MGTYFDCLKRSYMVLSILEVKKKKKKCRIVNRNNKIYKYVLENGSITIVETVKILDVKHRRDRAVLLNICFSCKKKCEENGK